MTISKDLFLALLSMDAYNRGYGAGVDLGQNSDKSGTLLGSATILKSKGDQEAQDAGFYAVAYKTTKDIGTKETGGIIPAETTIISYRGTDNFTNDPIAAEQIF